MLRAVRLLQSVEAGITNGAALEALLADAGRVSDLSTLLGMREQVRRMANSTVTMNALMASPIAAETTFGMASPDSKVAIDYMVKSPTAMSMVSGSKSTLDVIEGNDTSWHSFSNGAYFEDNVLSIMHLLTEIPQGTHSSMALFVANTQGSAAIATFSGAMKAAVSSQPTMALITQDATAMGNIASDTDSMGIVANSDMSMHLVSQSAIALAAVSDEAREVVTSTPSAVKIISSYPVTWASVVTGPDGVSPSSTLAANLRNILVNINDLNASFESATEIIASASAMGIVAGNAASMFAILTDPTAKAALIASPNLAAVLANSTAMGAITGNDSVMGELIGNGTAFPLLLASSAARDAIFGSPALISTMSGNAAAMAILTAGAASHVGPMPDGKIGTYQSAGVSGNIILLTIVMRSIVATTLGVTLAGTGAGQGTSVNVPGTSLSSGPIDVVGAYTDLTYDVASIAATAAAQIAITYYDFS